MTVLLIEILSPFGAIAITSSTFWPSSRVIVVEKSPARVGVITSSEKSVITVITELVDVFPDMTRILLSTTSSSFGRSNVRKTEGIGVGVGDVKDTVFVLVGTIVFVA